MEKLNKYDMEYIAGCGSTPYWRNPETKKYEPRPFPEGRKAFLDGLLVEDPDHLLYMDNHGVNIHLCTYRETEDGPLLGFLWGASSEECFYGLDYFSERSVGPFEVKEKKIIAYEYSRADGTDWQL